MFSTVTRSLRTAATPLARSSTVLPRLAILSPRSYTTSTDASASTDRAAAGAGEGAVAELSEKIEAQNKLIAELKDSRLRSLADFENLQKISVREKAQAKDFALTSFAKDLISSIDILTLALNSIVPAKLTADPASGFKPNDDLVSLYQGVTMTKKEILKVLKRHGVVAFDPTGEQFDPNRHEALYQAPVPGKEPGSVLECQEIGYMIKDRLLRAAKVGVVLGSQ